MRNLLLAPFVLIERFFRNVAMFFLRLVFGLVVFLDFLEDCPAKISKAAARACLAAILIFLSIGYLVRLEESNAKGALAARLYYVDLASPPLILPKYPVLKEDVKFPNISSKAFVIYDLKRDTVLKEYNAHTPMPPASTTKLMTAVVAREIYPLDRRLRVPENCAHINYTQNINLGEGEIISVEDLINALLISSAGDAACTLAYGSGDYARYIREMNDKAAQLGMKDTHFTNPIGLDDYSSKHVSSARDLLLLSKEVLTDGFLSNVVKTKDYTMTSGRVTRQLSNTNNLLWDVPGTLGIKTGKTSGAGEVLTYRYTKDGLDLLIVVMGSLDRFSDTKNILEWSMRSFDFGVGTFDFDRQQAWDLP